VRLYRKSGAANRRNSDGAVEVNRTLDPVLTKDVLTSEIPRRYCIRGGTPRFCNTNCNRTAGKVKPAGLSPGACQIVLAVTIEWFAPAHVPIMALVRDGTRQANLLGFY